MRAPEHAFKDHTHNFGNEIDLCCGGADNNKKLEHKLILMFFVHSSRQTIHI